jgi:hypothetical protein
VTRGFPKLIYEDRDEDQLQLAPDATPLDGLRAVYTNGKIPLPTRLRAMVEAAPYVHPKVAVTASIGGEDFAVMLETRLRKINGGKINAEKAKLIEAPKIDLDL